MILNESAVLLLIVEIKIFVINSICTIFLRKIIVNIRDTQRTMLSHIYISN